MSITSMISKAITKKAQKNQEQEQAHELVMPEEKSLTQVCKRYIQLHDIKNEVDSEMKQLKEDIQCLCPHDTLSMVIEGRKLTLTRYNRTSESFDLKAFKVDKEAFYNRYIKMFATYTKQTCSNIFKITVS